MSISDYSLLAVTLAGLQNSNAEVIYTDIEDVILDFDYEEYYCDLDLDGVDDFRFIKFSGTFIYSTSSSSATELRRFNSIRMRPGTNLGIAYNSIAGGSISTYWGFPNYLPYPLETGETIDADLQFNQNLGTHFLASRLDKLPAEIGWMHTGYWYPSLEDRYVGVHFRDIDNQYHYGWIRCSVLDSAEVLVIKDFAYETEINYPIVAGDTTQYVGISSESQTNTALVYAFGSHLYVKLISLNNAADIKIHDTQGRMVYATQIGQSYNDIDLSGLPAGNYMITLVHNETLLTKQVFITR